MVNLSKGQLATIMTMSVAVGAFSTAMVIPSHKPQPLESLEKALHVSTSNIATGPRMLCIVDKGYYKIHAYNETLKCELDSKKGQLLKQKTVYEPRPARPVQKWIPYSGMK